METKLVCSKYEDSIYIHSNRTEILSKYEYLKV